MVIHEGSGNSSVLRHACKQRRDGLEELGSVVARKRAQTKPSPPSHLNSYGPPPRLLFCLRRRCNRWLRDWPQVFRTAPGVLPSSDLLEEALSPFGVVYDPQGRVPVSECP
mgnify:CR=1 FL=1